MSRRTRKIQRAAFLTLGALIILAILAWFVLLLLGLGAEALSVPELIAVSSLKERMWGYLIYTMALGITTMAIIQVVRGIYPVRGLFHSWAVRRWLREGIKSSGIDIGADQAMEHLVELAVTMDRRELMDLPIERLSGQIGAAAELVLDEPLAHGNLLVAMTGSAGVRHVDTLLHGGDDTQSDEPREQRDNRKVKAHSALAHQIQRNIDGLQIRAGRQWRRTLRVSAVLVCMLSAWYLSDPQQVSLWQESGEAQPTVSRQDPGGSAGNGGSDSSQAEAAEGAPTSRLAKHRSRLTGVFLSGLLGGFWASTARDLLASLQKRRR